MRTVNRQAEPNGRTQRSCAIAGCGQPTTGLICPVCQHETAATIRGALDWFAADYSYARAMEVA